MTDDFTLHLIRPGDRLAANAVVLQIVPHVLIGIQFRRVGRKEEQLELFVNRLQEATHFHRLVGRMTIDDQEDGPVHSLHQPFEEGDEYIRSDAALHAHEAEIATPADRRNQIQTELGTRRRNDRDPSPGRPRRACVSIGPDSRFVTKPNHGLPGLGQGLDLRVVLMQSAVHSGRVLLIRTPQRTLGRQAQLVQQPTHGGTTEADAKTTLDQLAHHRIGPQGKPELVLLGIAQCHGLIDPGDRPTIQLRFTTSPLFRVQVIPSAIAVSRQPSIDRRSANPDERQLLFLAHPV